LIPAKLCESSGVSLPTIKRIETKLGRVYANRTTLNAIVLAFEAAALSSWTAMGAKGKIAEGDRAIRTVGQSK